MNSQELRAEIAKLEEEGRQILANANFVNGALQMAHKLLNSLEHKEKPAEEAHKDTAQ